MSSPELPVADLPAPASSVPDDPQENRRHSTHALSPDEQAAKLRNLVSKSDELRQIEKQRSRFNLLRVLSVDQGEIRHSNILGWLLRPEETHGLRDKFLRRWLTRVFSDAQPELGGPVEPVIFDTMELRDVEVRREWRNIDLLIRLRGVDGEEWVVAVENKWSAVQSDDQLLRYRVKVKESFGHGAARFAFIYLRSDPTDDPADDYWVPATHKQVYEVLHDLVEQESDLIGRDPGTLLRHYLQVLKDFTMDKTDIEQLARRIYQAHGDALDLILRFRPDALNELTERLVERLDKEGAQLGVKRMLCSKGYVRFVPVEWNSADNLEGTSWGQGIWSNGESAHVLCELSFGNTGAPFLKILEAGAPKEWRTELFELSKQNASFKKLQKRSTLAADYSTLYSVKAKKIEMEDLEAAVDEMTDELWDWLKEQLENRDWKASVAAVTEHFKRFPSASKLQPDAQK